MTNILLMKDDKTNAKNVKWAFNKFNHQHPIDQIGNRSEALTMMRDAHSQPPHIHAEGSLVLLNLHMLNMGKIEFFPCRSGPQTKSTPVVVIATSNQDRDRIDAYKFNVVSFLF
ncbi:response regulator [Nostocales cyanobacterium LEGE 11386]|nr:response regulator [Nostocales cyanobacterium LEGE 11386]